MWSVVQRVPVLVLIKILIQLVQTSYSQFILLLSTLFPHAVRWIRSTSCSRIQHEKIQVNFLHFQLKLKAVTSHWDQFITSVLVLPCPYCVKNRLGNTSGMCCLSWWVNSLFVVQLSLLCIWSPFQFSFSIHHNSSTKECSPVDSLQQETKSIFSCQTGLKEGSETCCRSYALLTTSASQWQGGFRWHSAV